MKRIDKILSNDSYKSYISYIENKEKSRRFCCHGMEHCLDVARIAYIISLEENMEIDKELIYAAALLHDIGRAMEYKDGSPHHETGAEIAEKILGHTDFSSDEIKTICHAIACHKSESDGDGLCSLLYRADKLSRCCFNCEAYDECYWDEGMKSKTILY